MLMRISTLAVGSAAALALLAGPAVAAVTVDLATGTGSVGKGDVQLVFGWNNAAMQKNASAISFRATDVTEYEVECKADYEVLLADGVNRKGETVYKKSKVRVRTVLEESSVAVYDTKSATKSNPQGSLTGWTLNGNSLNTSLSEAAPAEGDACTAEDASGVERAGKLTDAITATESPEGDKLDAVHKTSTGEAVRTIWTAPAQAPAPVEVTPAA